MICSLNSIAFAKHYYRFWRGHIAEQMSDLEFEKAINKIFIPETVEQGRGHGLISYMPVFITRNTSAKTFTDELALVVYETKEKYMAIREMPRGSNYQKLHWKYFDRRNSKRRVPQIYNGKIKIETAYDLLQSDLHWQNGKSQFLMRKFKNGLNKELLSNLQNYLTTIQTKSKNFGILSHIVLVDQQGIYEYILYDKSIDPRTEYLLFSNEIQTLMNIVLKNKNGKINSGEGANRQFSLVKPKQE